MNSDFELRFNDREFEFLVLSAVVGLHDISLLRRMVEDKDVLQERNKEFSTAIDVLRKLCNEGIWCDDV